MKEFMYNANREFTDPQSLEILQLVYRAGSSSDGDECNSNDCNDSDDSLAVGSVVPVQAVPAMSVALVKQFNQWNKETCTDQQGGSTGRCCYDCLIPTLHKLSRYQGYDSLMTCGHNGEGWCGKNQKVPRALLKAIGNATGPVSTALQGVEEHKQSSGATGGAGSGATGGGTGGTGGSEGEGEKPGLTYDRTSMETTAKQTKFRQTDLVMRLKSLQSQSKHLEHEAEGILQKSHASRSTMYKLDSKTRDIVDRTKLTLLSERVGVMKMLNREKKSGQPGQGGEEERQLYDEEDSNEVERYESANEEIPSLLDGIHDFVSSGQAGKNLLLEMDESE